MTSGFALACWSHLCVQRLRSSLGVLGRAKVKEAKILGFQACASQIQGGGLRGAQNSDQSGQTNLKKPKKLKTSDHRKTLKIVMATGAAGDGMFQRLYDGCISTDEMVVRRRPYHINCNCALHKYSGGGHCSPVGKVSYPMRRSWSEGSMAAMNSSMVV
ncbi:hypothetical protein L6452_18841 [Arctium lappa]|uniref:Uncharacterized protein n=1 Tax=Arctium lappa TaxID=4217 RepID=A0ACB9C7E9_ARCLA|nr:hypothetical protein L6452_18841 [Arctium lappa]